MSLNLLDQAKSYFNNEVINQANGSLNESESNLSKAIEVIIPTIVGWISDKAQTPEGSAELIKAAADQESKGVLNTIGKFLHHEDGATLRDEGATLSNSLFENKHVDTIKQISSYAGIKASSVSTLISMALPTILGLLGKHFKANDFSTDHIADFFIAQKATATGFLPADFTQTDLKSTFSEAKVIDPIISPEPPKAVPVKHIEPVVAHETHHATHEEKKERPKGIWVLPLIAVILAVLAAWWFTRDTSDGKHEQSHDTTVVHSETTTKETTIKGKLDSNGDFIYDEGDSVSITLPNNAGILKVGKYSTEARLVAFLTDNDAKIDTVKGNWFEFTNVHFKLNSTELTDQSNNQLKNMVAITKAFPTAKFKFGGYTDNTGSAETNITLSQKRADAIAVLVQKLGANKAAFEASKGYGPEFPVANNETPEGRAQNRRVAINVKAK